MVKEKLVRDNIPDIIRNDGIEPRIRIAKNEELDTLLRAKIVEESTELLESGSAEEVADILEAIEAFLSHRQIDRINIERLQFVKREQRGGYKKGFVLVTEESEIK